MQTYKVAWLLFKNNRKLYQFYMLVMIVTIAIYYNFLAVSYNPYVTAVTEKMESARTAGTMCSGILFVVLLFFMLHAAHFFYKQRYKEIATYMLMGVKKGKIARVIVLENSIVGVISLVLGTLLGIIFSKLFFMMLGSRSILNVAIPFYFSMKTVITLILLVGSILIVIACRNSYMVRRSRLIQLLNASKKEEVIPKMRLLRSILGVAAIGWGYYLTIKTREVGMEQANYWLLIVGAVCVGTYLFFSGFFSLVLAAAIKHKAFSYKGTRLISLSNTLFRLGSNYRSYAATTILCAAALTALMTSFAINQFDRDRIKYEAPYSFSYLAADETLYQKINEKIATSDHKLLGSSQVHFIKADCIKETGEEAVKEEYFLVPFSEIKGNLKMLDYPELEKQLKRIQPDDQHISMIKHANVAFSGEKVKGQSYEINGSSYGLKAVEKIPFLGGMPNIGGMDAFVVTDETYQELKGQMNAEEQCLNNFVFTEQEHSLELVSELMRLVPDCSDHCNSYAAQYQGRYYIFGAFYFLGIVLSFVFMITVFSTIYFKCISDAYSDQKQYEILIKMGIQKEHIRKSIDMQLALAVVIPILLGTLHSWFAMGMLESFMHIDLMESKVKAIGILVVCLVLGMLFINRNYRKMVMQKA